MTKQEFLAMSLPYNLKIKHFDVNRESEHICKIEVWHNEEVTISDGEYEYDLLLNDILPIVRPLSDLSRCIIQKEYNNEEPFFPLYRLQKEDKAFTTDFIYAFGVEECKFAVIELLLKWHFDLFGGIESGESINVNTLDINPYK